MDHINNSRNDPSKIRHVDLRLLQSEIHNLRVNLNDNALDLHLERLAHTITYCQRLCQINVQISFQPVCQNLDHMTMFILQNTTQPHSNYDPT